MALSEIYIKLVVGFPRDPKVRRLITVCGVEAGLARDLYLAMALHCKENLTDGWVPAEEIGALAYPLPPDHANQLAKQLASVGLIKEESKNEAQGWQVVAYLKRNGTREDVEYLSMVRAEAGRKGGRPRGQSRSKANRNQVAKQNKSRPNPYTETESETEPKDLAAETPGQRANRLARVYTDQVPVSNFPAIAAIVRKAVDADVSDGRIAAGLRKVIAENRSLTTETLRVAIYGPPKAQSTTNDRVAQALEAGQRVQDMLDHQEGTA